MKNLASFAPSETADNRNPSPQPPVAGSGNTPGTGEERARQSDLSDAGQGDGVDPAKSPAGYETACPAALAPKVSAPLDTSNEFSVCLRGDDLVGIYGLPVKHLRRDQALRLAVWIVGEVDPELKVFRPMLQEILK